jgi:hypothetical protein
MYRDNVIKYAQSQIGTNHGSRQWCGTFALKCLHESGLGRDIPAQEKSGKALRDLLPRIRYTEALPGDIVAWGEHVAILVRIDGMVMQTIDGTEGSQAVYGATRGIRQSDAVFFSIQPLINEACLITGAECSI